MFLKRLFVLMALTGLTAAPALTAVEEVEFTVAGMTCLGCETKSANALKKIPGIGLAGVNYPNGKGYFMYEGDDLDKTVQAARDALADLGYDLLLEGESVTVPLTSEERANADLYLVTEGEAFNLKHHMAKGKITLVDFVAPWCAPCKVLTPKLERLTVERDNIALRKVDLVDWESDASRIAQGKYKVQGLPYVMVFDEQGKLLGTVRGNFFDQIMNIVDGGEAQ
ncbi:MAG: hypothetical protein HKN21_16045 [Candidatus Eisenbacteria bacterium]|uniref:Thioredoxin domain-containing protein n=1 Tax=Eiseniibacteriota bacterium TaxID=2212470 RepID=A0A7Y2EEB4_UNCEI|nr:hypothetical protein [Candidatus Eisenbacteria bacterium]